MRIAALLIRRRLASSSWSEAASGLWARRSSAVGGWSSLPESPTRSRTVRWRSLATRTSPAADPEKLTVVKLKEILDSAGPWPDGLKRSSKKAELVAAVREVLTATGAHDAAATRSLDRSRADPEPGGGGEFRALLERMGG